MRACRWDEADALIAQLDDAPERQAKLRARLNAERRAEAYVGEAGYKSGLEERSARLGNVANKSLCDATRQAAASARETMLATLGEDSVTACDPDTARWAMNQLGSGSGHAQIKALLDKEDRARQALGSYRQARASGNRDAARQAAIDARDNAVCRDTKSAAGSNVDDYNRANRQASAKPTPRRGTGGTSSPGGGGGTGGGGSSADPRCSALIRDMQDLGTEAQQLAKKMQQLAYSGQRSSAGQVQALQGRLMTITRQVETQRNEFRQLGCDRAAVRDTSQCQQWLDEMYQMEQSIKSYRAGMLRCGDNRSCITRHQNAMKATAGKSQRLSSQLQSQCRK